MKEFENEFSLQSFQKKQLLLDTIYLEMASNAIKLNNSLIIMVDSQPRKTL